MRWCRSFNPSSGNSSETPTPRGPVRQSSSAGQSEHEAPHRPYTRTIQTTHVVDIKSKLQSFSSGAGDDSAADSGGVAAPPLLGLSRSAHLLSEVLQPDREAVEEALRRVRSGRLSRIVSDYFGGSESTSRLCLRLHGRIECARAIYTPLLNLLEDLPSAATTAGTTAASSPVSIASPSSSQNRHRRRRRSHQFLSPSQCEWVVQVFKEFYVKENPFSGAAGFPEMCRCLDELREELRACLRLARRRARLLPGVAVYSAVCLIGSALAITLGVLLAAHALPAMGAALKRRLTEHIAQLDAAAKGVFVLRNHLNTVERLVRRVDEAVEDDRGLVLQALTVAEGDRRFVESTLRQLRPTRAPLHRMLQELEDHVCHCCTTINSARNLLFELIDRRHGRRRAAAGSSDEQGS
ncbi:unnamed protein product [Spirodela intermedia]|uniref:Uncharacterized protein n=1 Tax=Spirodela intermedia TaxID=51605 RepID=A0A7I8JLF1_SPIIN|nr:unnamed protein product [Spirodela intermedia]CAA6670403.1 unnamed protein product [Spirodela intermedia]